MRGEAVASTTGGVRRYLRRTGKAVGTAIVLMQVVMPAVESYVVTHSRDTSVPTDELGAVHEDVSIRTGDGVELRGWYVPSTNGAAVLVFPGRSAGSQRHARMLITHGYGVLLLDRRGTGESEGQTNGYGWGAEADVHTAIDFLQHRPDVDPARIGGLGLSVGGELLLQAASDDPGLRAVVSEGAGLRSFDEFMEIDALDRWLMAPLLLTTTWSVAALSGQLPPPNLMSLVPHIDAPVFFIYATDGQGGEELTEEYYAVTRAPKELWQTPGGHTQGLTTSPEEYERRVVGFLDRTLLGN